MATLPQFKLRQLARRRSSDVDRLSTQFRQNVESLTGEYETAFQQYQKQRAEKMMPFEAEMERYRTVSMPAYEAATTSYKQALDAYNVQLKEIEANPFIERVERQMVGRNWRGKKKYADVTVYEERPIPKFDAVKPELPVAPTAPVIEEFNAAPFEGKKSALQQEFSREVAERRAGRLSAASRKTARPLLQGSGS